MGRQVGMVCNRMAWWCGQEAVQLRFKEKTGSRLQGSSLHGSGPGWGSYGFTYSRLHSRYSFLMPEHSETAHAQG